MTRRLAVLPPATSDLSDASRWYESKAPGLGRAFLAHVNVQSRRILHFPESYPRYGQNWRRANLQRFPYTIIYRILPDLVEVGAVFPMQVNPAVLASRLTSLS
jgi:hypothetical protein